MDFKNYLNLLNIESQIEDIQKWFSNDKISKPAKAIEQKKECLAQLDNKHLEIVACLSDLLN